MTFGLSNTNMFASPLNTRSAAFTYCNTYCICIKYIQCNSNESGWEIHLTENMPNCLKLLMKWSAIDGNRAVTRLHISPDWHTSLNTKDMFFLLVIKSHLYILATPFWHHHSIIDSSLCCRFFWDLSTNYCHTWVSCVTAVGLFVYQAETAVSSLLATLTLTHTHTDVNIL